MKVAYNDRFTLYIKAILKLMQFILIINTSIVGRSKQVFFEPR